MAKPKGGARPGAGRPRVDSIGVNFRLRRETLEWIDAQEGRRSEVIEKLVRADMNKVADCTAGGESQGKPHAHIQELAAHLAAVLAEIEARAKELNHHFDRAQWPGTKAEFRAFLRWKDENLAYRLPADDGRLSDELRPHGVKFGRPGRDTTKGLNFYRALFPDYPA